MKVTVWANSCWPLDAQQSQWLAFRNSSVYIFKGDQELNVKYKHTLNKLTQLQKLYLSPSVVYNAEKVMVIILQINHLFLLPEYELSCTWSIWAWAWPCSVSSLRTSGHGQSSQLAPAVHSIFFCSRDEICHQTMFSKFPSPQYQHCLPVGQTQMWCLSLWKEISPNLALLLPSSFWIIIFERWKTVQTLQNEPR